MKDVKQHALLVVEAVFLAVLLAASIIMDNEYAVSLSWQFYLVMPILALSMILPALLSAQRKPAALLFLTFSLLLLFLPLSSFGVSKSFIKFHRQISNGMTVSEVQHLFTASFPADNKFSCPIWQWRGSSSLQYMMDSTHDRVDSISVYFQDGRVVRTEYMPD